MAESVATRGEPSRHLIDQRAQLGIEPEDSFCGCCGNECPEADLWCRRCDEHVIDARHPWEATYFAVHGIDCPYAVTDSSEASS